ncbi:MAG: RNA polymerase sigma factor [Elusimicrobiota bacterium]|nr:RNA polymerase sigma factor [Elusimicrobiota bacterium]
MTEAGSTEGELVLKSQSGDRAAFEALMAATHVQAWANAWRLTGNQTDAEDLVQETYVKAWIAIPKFRGQAGFATWLYRIEFNCHADRKRKSIKRREISLDGDSGDDDKPVMQIADPSPGAPAQLEALERICSIRKVLESIDPVYKQVLVLRELEGFSYEDIGAVLNIPQGTVAAWLFRARVAFREAYFKITGDKV